MTSYPATPWKLRGHGLVNVQSVDVSRVRPFLPPELDILQIFPGKTFGGVYLAAYEAGSDLQYNELIVFGGAARYQNRVGIWVTHIYVDLEESVAGGREIWGLPKQLAKFEWIKGDRPQVSVYQESQLLCQLALLNRDMIYCGTGTSPNLR